MSKLTLLIIVTIGWWGIVAAPMAATQSAVGSWATNQPDGISAATRYLALAKKCTLRRYRRPH